MCDLSWSLAAAIVSEISVRVHIVAFFGSGTMELETNSQGRFRRVRQRAVPKRRFSRASTGDESDDECVQACEGLSRGSSQSHGSKVMEFDNVEPPTEKSTMKDVYVEIERSSSNHDYIEIQIPRVREMTIEEDEDEDELDISLQEMGRALQGFVSNEGDVEKPPKRLPSLSALPIREVMITSASEDEDNDVMYDAATDSPMVISLVSQMLDEYDNISESSEDEQYDYDNVDEPHAIERANSQLLYQTIDDAESISSARQTPKLEAHEVNFCEPDGALLSESGNHSTLSQSRSTASNTESICELFQAIMSLDEKEVEAEDAGSTNTMSTDSGMLVHPALASRALNRPRYAFWEDFFVLSQF